MTNTIKNETFQEASFVGSTSLTNVKAKELSILGSLKFHNLIVTQDADIAGPVIKSKNGTFAHLSVLGNFEVSDVTCSALDVAGSVVAMGLTVKGETSIVGSLVLKAHKDQTHFPNHLQTLIISAEHTALTDTTVDGDIIVHTSLKNKAFKWLGRETQQVLHLLGKTVIKGGITFESGTGIIKQGREAKVTGKITGATIVQKKKG